LLIYNTTLISDDVAISLTSESDTMLYIGVAGFIGSRTQTAIYADVNNAFVTVDGTIVGAYGGILLGYVFRDETGVVDESIGVRANFTASARVFSTYNPIEIQGHDARVTNAGRVESIHYSGIAITSLMAGKASSIVNSGDVIGGDVGAGVYFEGVDDGRLTNEGTISGGNSAFNSLKSSADMTVLNHGTMKNGILFGAGNDIYNGSDGSVTGVVSGGAGRDRLTGGAAADDFDGGRGRDILAGGKGADHFIFDTLKGSTVAKSGRDLIGDFSTGQKDIIDLSDIDARSGTPADDAFKFIGSHGFTGHAGELRLAYASRSTLVQMDANGDGHADSAIELSGRITLHASDFIL
jgi:Ca2+-binding RTX toxin-like protein